MISTFRCASSGAAFHLQQKAWVLWLISRKTTPVWKSDIAKSAEALPWVCGRCSREFVYSNLRELTVHHIDHDHSNNPEDGSNWEMLCLYCHDHEHSKYTEADQYGSTVVAGEDAQKSVGEAKYNPFADLKAMMNKK